MKKPTILISWVSWWKRSVTFEIPFWPYGIKRELCEALELQICPLEKISRPELPPTKTLNKGKYIIHIGGQYDSQLRLPIINQ
mgnify:CR=1 FL=1